MKRASHYWAGVCAWLPQGGLLPQASWEQRHKAVRLLLVLHSGGLALFGVIRGASPAMIALCGLLPLVMAWVAGLPGVSRMVQSTTAAVGLMATSALLVELSGGSIEAHFHFFVMVPVVALYEDWIPFGIAVLFVLIHHGVLGEVDPRGTFDHPDAWNRPWRWAGLHAAFLSAACMASIINWHLHERARESRTVLFQRMATQAETDALTGLPNRNVLLREGATALVGAGRGPLAVLLMDLDRFKDVNDTLGHSRGDLLLKVVAQRLAEAVAEADVLVRLGGDEFGILLRATGMERAVRIAEHLRSVIGAEAEIDGLGLDIDVSIGVAMATSADTDSDIELLVRQADIAMYAAKEAGGGVAVFSDELDTHNRSQLTTLTDLRRGIAEGELRAFFQPKVSVDTGTLVGVEVLVRWEHPERGLLAPGAFVPAAEVTPLIMPLTLTVLDLAISQAARWLEAGYLVPVAVNLAARTLHDLSVLQSVQEVLERHGLPASLLRLEITESTLMTDPKAAQVVLEGLRALGIRLSIDDFGTGYSSLQYLKRVPVDEIKVDRSFVAGMLTSGDDAAIVKSVIDLGHNLGLSVVAEGVESEEIAQALRELACDVLQGYHYARPGPASTIDPYLARAPKVSDLAQIHPQRTSPELLAPR